MKKIIIAICALGIYSTSMAQTNTEEQIKKLNEVVISANKFSEKKKKVAQKIDIVTAAEMKKMNAQTMADVIINSGKAFVQKSQLGGGSPVIRGFEASRVLLMVDGIRLNNAIYRAGHLQNIVTVDNNIVDRVEILSGPASTIHGSDALGGVISMQTKNPILGKNEHIELTGLNALVRYSSACQEKTTHADFTFGSNRFGSLTSISYSKFEDLLQGKNGVDSIMNLWKKNFTVQQFNGIDSAVKNSNPYLQTGTGYSQYDLLQKFTIMSQGKLKHGINLQYSNSTDVPRYDRLTETSGGVPKNAEWYYGPQKRMLAAYTLDVKNVGTIANDFTATLSYQNIEESRNNRGFKKSTIAHRIEKVNVIGYNLALRKNINEHEITYGSDGQFNNLTSKAYKTDIVTNVETKIDTRYPDGLNKMNLFGLFVQHRWNMDSRNLVLNDGIRFNATSLHATLEDTAIQFKLPYTDISQKNTAITGNIGIVYNPEERIKFSANYATGFRSPNFDDMTKIFESVSGSRLIVPNTNLKPEYTNTIEASLEYKDEDNLFEVYGFYTNFNNAITLDTFQYEGKDSVMYNGVNTRVYASVNKVHAFVYGGGINMAHYFSREFKMYGNVNYTYGRFNQGDTILIPLDHVAPVFGKVGFMYSEKLWSFDLYSLFNGKKALVHYNPNGEDNIQYATPQGMPAWYTINVKSNIQIHENILLQVGVENILDKNYRYFASGMSAAGRNYIVALRFNLK